MDIIERWMQLRHGRDGLLLYALVDGARFGMRYGIVPTHRKPGWHSLFAGTADAQLAHAGPWLIELAKAGSEMSAQLVTLEREAPSLSWIIAMQDATGLAQLLRLSMEAKMADGRVALLRFWDPRVLASLVDICTPIQLEQLIGPIEEWHFLRGGARCWLGPGAC